MYIKVLLLFFGMSLWLNATIEDDSSLKGIAHPDINYVLKKYQKNFNGIDFLFFPARNPKRLVIVFAGREDKYHFWSWFWKDSENWEKTAYVFLKDNRFQWFIGTSQNSLVPKYTQIINYCIRLCNLSSAQTFAVGSSMGAYAALYYGITMQFKGIFAGLPQITWDLAVNYVPIDGIRENWIDIAQLAITARRLPFIYIQESNFIYDKEALYYFLTSLKQRPDYLVIANQTSNLGHTPFLPTKTLIKKTLRYFESLEYNENDYIPY